MIGAWKKCQNSISGFHGVLVGRWNISGLLAGFRMTIGDVSLHVFVVVLKREIKAFVEQSNPGIGRLSANKNEAVLRQQVWRVNAGWEQAHGGASGLN